MKDWRGYEIKVGSVIVYPGRAMSSMWVTEAMVKSVLEPTGDRHCDQGEILARVTRTNNGRESGSRSVKLTVIDRVTVVT